VCGVLAVLLPVVQARSPQDSPRPAAPRAAPATAEREERLAPALIAREGPAQRPLGLARVGIEATVVGLLARTRTTLVFRNDTDRVLEGELVFPLPPGATISGYALDVQGELADAVPVEREQARIAFEQEVRRGVDPGLVEWVRGNAFRTRVYPIPARGTRTVRVDFVSNLATPGGAALYRLPLGLRDSVRELSLRVEVVKSAERPELRGEALANLSFEHWREGWVAERSWKDASLAGELVVAVPQAPGRDVAVEERDGAFFFLAHDTPEVPAAPARTRPRRVALLWDASLSRADADREPELRFVAAWLRRLGDVEVALTAFRNLPESERVFTIRGGDAAALLEHLRSLPLDGGTSFQGLSVGKDVDHALLVSDGLGTLDEALPGSLRAPVYALPVGPRADHAFLRRLAEGSGGQLLDPARDGVEPALDGLGVAPFSLLGIDVEPRGAVSDLLPSGPRPVGGRVDVAGRLLAPEARLTLRYGRPGSPVLTRTLVVRRSEAAGSGLVSLAWAQRRVEELAVFPDANREELTRLGQQFGIVTPGTSLLVLETLEQHLTHGIEPPASRPALREAYRARRAELATSGERAKLEKLERVVAQWAERVAWWEQVVQAPKQKIAGDGTGRDAERAFTAPVEMEYAPAGPGVPGGVEGGVPGGVVGGVVGGLPDAPRPAMRAANGGAASGLARDADARKGDSTTTASPSTAASIAIRPWDPQTPYLAAMREAGAARAYATYLTQRDQHGRSPAFFLDCADELARQGQRDLALRVLTSVVELELDDPRLLRVAAHRLLQVGEHDLAVRLFTKVARLRAEEPQSPRDLAIALVARADARRSRPGWDRVSVTADYERAVRALYDIVLGAWDGRFPEIETIALEELNRVLAIAEREGLKLPARGIVDARLRKLLDVDLRVVMTWDTDQTDMDLWVVEPSGERCYYGHNRTASGGLVSRDFTGGYGPEEFLVRRAPGGEYKVQTNYYGSRSQSLVGATTVQATVITNFGRADETRQALTLRLTTARDTVDIGSVTVGGPSLTR
jgi:Flp pilus assembly protein TadD